jgi:phosphatidylglycerophosphatase A
MPSASDDRFAILKNPVHLLAFGFGSGLSPKAPGTVGTLVAIPLYLLLVQLSLPLYLAAIMLAFIAGIWLCGRTAHDLGVHDHGGIVWDEFVGFWITMILVPLTWYWVLAGFIAFRVFDIFKPFPIGWLDRKIGGGLGIMIDDVIAGLYAALVIQLLMALTGF